MKKALVCGAGGFIGGHMVKRLKSEGYFLIALSGSEMYSVQKFTEKLGFDLAFGENYHESSGVFNGEIDKVVGKKDIFLKKFAEDHNLSLGVFGWSGTEYANETLISSEVGCL